MLERTEEKRVKIKLDDVSQNYMDEKQKNSQIKSKPERGGSSPHPVLAFFGGVCGIGGAIAGYVLLNSILIAVVCSLGGCIVCAMFRGSNGDYDSFGARFCMGMAAVSLVAGMVCLTIYLKGIGVWDFLIK